MRDRIIPRKKHWFRSLGITIILFLIIIWGVVAVVRAYIKYQESIALEDQVNRELQELENSHTELSQKIDYLKTERGIEEELRNRYRVAKTGEELVVIVDNGQMVSEELQPGFWQKLRNFIGF